MFLIGRVWGDVSQLLEMITVVVAGAAATSHFYIRDDEDANLIPCHEKPGASDNCSSKPLLELSKEVTRKMSFGMSMFKVSANDRDDHPFSSP